MPRSFIDFLNSMTIAMEADDITDETANEVRSAVGGALTTDNDPVDREDQENLEEVDDIFGLQDANTTDGPSGDPEQDSVEGTEDLPPEEGEENPEGAEDPNVTGDNAGEAPPAEEESPDPDLAFAQKNRIRDNFVQLYNVISNDIEILVNALTNINEIQNVHVFNAVLNHLRNAKDYIYKTLTVNLTTLEYDELLQRYITLKRVYDICIQMLEKQFLDSKRDS